MKRRRSTRRSTRSRSRPDLHVLDQNVVHGELWQLVLNQHSASQHLKHRNHLQMNCGLSWACCRLTLILSNVSSSSGPRTLMSEL